VTVMTTKDDSRDTWRSVITLVVLLSFAGVLTALALRPGRASLWPVGEWPSTARGPVGLDEPPQR